MGETVRKNWRMMSNSTKKRQSISSNEVGRRADPSKNDQWESEASAEKNDTNVNTTSWPKRSERRKVNKQEQTNEVTNGVKRTTTTTTTTGGMHVKARPWRRWKCMSDVDKEPTVRMKPWGPDYERRLYTYNPNSSLTIVKTQLMVLIAILSPF